MQLQKQVYLSIGPCRQIAYPPDFEGEKSGDEDDENFSVSTQPRFLTSDEVELAEAYINSIPDAQRLQYTGAVLVDPEDSLLKASVEELRRVIEQEKLNLPVEASGGTLPVQAIVLSIREAGYAGNGKRAIASGK
jgi:hypothetical protein